MDVQIVMRRPPEFEAIQQTKDNLEEIKKWIGADDARWSSVSEITYEFPPSREGGVRQTITTFEGDWLVNLPDRIEVYLSADFEKAFRFKKTAPETVVNIYNQADGS